MSKTVLFQTIQFSISTQYRSIWPVVRDLSSATTPGESVPRSDGKEGVLCIPQSISLFSVISRTLVMGSYPSAEVQPMYSTELNVKTVLFQIIQFRR